MKFNVQRWETRSLWNRFRLRALFALGFDAGRIHSTPQNGHVRVAKLYTLIHGHYAYHVYAYVSANPLLLGSSVVAYLTSRNRRKPCESICTNTGQ